MQKGSKKITAFAGQAFRINATSEFYALALDGSKEKRIIGPNNASDRWLSGILKPNENGISVHTEGFWEVEFVTPRRIEKVDPKPMEVPVELARPLTMREEMQAFIRRELSRAAQNNGVPTFEEEDDFDMPEAEWASPYELQDLIPENDETLDGEVPRGTPEDPPPEDQGAQRPGAEGPDAPTSSASTAS